MHNILQINKMKVERSQHVTGWTWKLEALLILGNVTCAKELVSPLNHQQCHLPLF